jgi:hypothetical protein
MLDTSSQPGNQYDRDSDEDYDSSAYASAGEDSDKGFCLGLFDKKEE